MSMETQSRRSEQETLLSVDSLDVKFEVADGTIHALRDVCDLEFHVEGVDTQQRFLLASSGLCLHAH